VIADPPLSVGALQLKLICEDEDVVAVKPVGGCERSGLLCEDKVIYDE
jgi:hypothetical protein